MQVASAESEEVRALREQLARVDRAIVVLLAARLALAARVIAARAGERGSETLRPQERVVLRRVRDWALDLDVPPDLVGDLFGALIEAGKERYRTQRPTLPATVGDGGGTPPTARERAPA